MDRDWGLDTPSKPYSCPSIPNYRWESTHGEGIHHRKDPSSDRRPHETKGSHLLDRIFRISLA